MLGVKKIQLFNSTAFYNIVHYALCSPLPMNSYPSGGGSVRPSMGGGAIVVGGTGTLVEVKPPTIPRTLGAILKIARQIQE